MAADGKLKVKNGYVGVPLFFRLFVFFGIILIAFVFIYYTQDVVGKLKANSLRMVNLSIKLLQVELSNETSGIATGVIFDEIIAPTDIPIIIADRNDEPLFFRNISGLKEEDVGSENTPKLKKKIAEMFRLNGRFPIKHIDRETGEETIINYFYYGDPQLIHRLQAMPFVEIGLVVLFFIAGYIGFKNIQRSEQHFIWVGMAKETAHQLGTPISSLLGWLELLKPAPKGESAAPSEKSNGRDLNEISERMAMDVERLQKIANRFSQIGSRPTLIVTDMNKVVSGVVEYFRERLPYQGQGIRIDFIPGKIMQVRINPELIGWVIENLIKNSLEACDPKTGRIRVETMMSPDGKTVLTEMKDNGKGILQADQKKIFHPGFTSKKRGWGLGLSLTRRIVEIYHKGRISLKSSIPDRETIMQVMLPGEPEES